jgi:hypothetical protein
MKLYVLGFIFETARRFIVDGRSFLFAVASFRFEFRDFRVSVVRFGKGGTTEHTERRELSIV